jgi:hypothetical protein
MADPPLSLYSRTGCENKGKHGGQQGFLKVVKG